MRQYLNSPSVQALLGEQAQKVATRAGDGFETSVRAGKNRAHGRVYAATWRAVGRNRRDNTLLKALGGGS
ncbi:hypothetical protein [Actinotignum urinale]|uniref:HK97 gp10 family phage protein n=1 Tax=Actinotignum urinale TaxID=190146 RepID=A0ABU5G4Z5_9ACTO|nr:hypothetical protein [Actinotignum urinale]MDY5132242.1 hypothetical protein [Actinotignum urinale]